MEHHYNNRLILNMYQINYTSNFISLWPTNFVHVFSLSHLDLVLITVRKGEGRNSASHWPLALSFLIIWGFSGPKREVSSFLCPGWKFWGKPHQERQGHALSQEPEQSWPPAYSVVRTKVGHFSVSPLVTHPKYAPGHCLWLLSWGGCLDQPWWFCLALYLATWQRQKDYSFRGEGTKRAQGKIGPYSSNQSSAKAEHLFGNL